MRMWREEASAREIGSASRRDAPGGGWIAPLLAAALLAAGGAASAGAQQEPLEAEAVPSALGEAVRHGSGPDTLVLIPCASCRWRSFDEFMERNADRYTMYAVTLPGYGGTDLPDLPLWTDSTLWRDHAVLGISDLLDDQDVGGAVVVGSSYGTTVAIHLASRRPDAIRGVVNLDGGFSRPPGRDTVPMADRLERAREVMERYGEPLRDPDRWQAFNTPAIVARPDRKLKYHGWFMATDPDAMMQYWRENLLDDGNGAFRSLEVPFLDVRALRPWDDTPEQTRRGVEATIDSIGPPPGYRRIFLYDTPHFVMEERPELLDRIVSDFLAGRRLDDVRPASPPSPPTAATPGDTVTAAVRAATTLVEAALARTGASDALREAGGLLIRADGTKNAGAELQGFHPDSLSPGDFRETLAFAPAPGTSDGLRVGWEYRHDRFDGTWESYRERYDADDARVIFILDQGFAVRLTSPDHRVARRRLLRRHPGLLLEEVRGRAAGLRARGSRDGREVVSASLIGGDVVDLAFDPETSLLREVTYAADAPGLGDVPVRWRFDDYRPVEGLGMVPHAYGVDLDGRPFTSMRVTRAAVGEGEAASILEPPEGIEVPAEAQAVPPEADASADAEVREVAPGVYLATRLRSGFHPMFVELDDHVVAMDAPAGYPMWDELPASDVAPGPTSSWLSERYLELIRETVPDKPVRYVVVTHFHNDHAGGLRAFVAEGATVLAPPSAEEAIRALVAAPHAVAPDRLARKGGELRLEVIRGSRTLGDGERTVQILDVGRNPHTAHMLVARIPDEDLWFVSDLLDPTRVERFPKPEHAALDRWFVEWLDREGHDPGRIYTIHGSGLVTPEHLERLRGLGASAGGR